MKNYIGNIIDLTGDSYLNPVGAQYGDGSGTHQRQVGSITSISVHHDASPRPHDYDSIARFRQEAAGHYDRLGPGLQYHYKIDNTGVIFAIRPWSTWLYVVGSSENTSCLAICLDGNFENEQPTREQYEALSQLVVELCDNHPEFPATYPDVRPHADYSSTACCGANLKPYVYSIQDKASAENIPNVAYDWPELQDAAPTPTATPEASHAEVPAVEQPSAPVVEPPVVSAPDTSVKEEVPTNTPTAPTQSETVPSESSATPGQASNHIPLTIPVVNNIINTIKDSFMNVNASRWTSRKFLLTVAVDVIAVAGAIVHYFTSTQSATLAGAATVAFVVIQGLIENSQAKN